jgi:hypothetical protein
MAERNNIYPITGTIYGKPIRLVKSKKDDKEYEFKSIILEVKKSHGGKTYTTLPEFHLGYGVSDDGFEVGDNVEITFCLEGKRISETWHKSDAKALYIKHTDIEGNDTRDVGGEVGYKKKEDVFVPPNPLDEGEDDGLPF